jgi:hypothetical protein
MNIKTLYILISESGKKTVGKFVHSEIDNTFIIVLNNKLVSNNLSSPIYVAIHVDF